MYKHLVISVGLLSGLACGHTQPASNTWRQDGAASDNRGSEQAPTQRQAELRSALRAQHFRGDELNKARREYQLSVQERSELRQQLRQQWRDGMGK
jgi:hypothetical protein